MTTTHRITGDLFQELASGHGGPAGVAVLRSARHSKVLLLLVRALSGAGRRTAAADLLGAVQAAHPSPTAEVLLYPWVGAWLADLAGRRWSGADDDYLTGVAISAARRAGERIPDPVWASARRLDLPAAGVSDRPPPDGWRAPHWVPVRWIDVGGGAAVALDDVDRHRTCYGLPMADRLGPAPWRHWRDLVVRAFESITAWAPGRAAELRAGLRAIAPLVADERSHGRSVTHRYAFGGFAAGLPASPEELAATAIHEFQHSKLNALMDVRRLHDPGGPAVHFAPWRADPRPVGALLHGTYAFAAVADYWDSLRAEPAAERLATVQAARYRAQVVRALRELEGARGLTASGRVVVTRLAADVAARSRPIEPEVQRRAERRVARDEDAWRARHDPRRIA